MARRSGSSGWLASALAGCAAIALAAPAAADVLEVGGDGTTLVRAGVGAVRWAGADAPGDADAPPLPDDIQVPDGATLSIASRAPTQYAAAVSRIATRYAISPALLEAVAWHESRWQPQAVSRVGAIGLVQLMPATARALRVDPAAPPGRPVARCL